MSPLHRSSRGQMYVIIVCQRWSASHCLGHSMAQPRLSTETTGTKVGIGVADVGMLPPEKQKTLKHMATVTSSGLPRYYAATAKRHHRLMPLKHTFLLCACAERMC